MIRQAAIAALLLVPSLTEAQRTNRGADLLTDWNKPDTAMGRPVPAIKQNEIEKLSAVHIIVDKKKDLKLNDEQVGKLKELAKAEESLNRPLYTRVDSLRLAMRRRAGEDGDQERARATIARQDILSVLREIRANYDSTFKMCDPILTADQLKLATELVEKERDEADADLRQKVGGRASGPSGARSTSRVRRP